MTSIMIEDEYVFVGGSAKGKIEDLLLFIGVKNSLTESKKGFCLFLDGRFWIQEGSAIHEGVADPMERGGIYKLFSFFKREDECSWSWQVKNEHLIWVGDRQFIIRAPVARIATDTRPAAGTTMSVFVVVFPHSL